MRAPQIRGFGPQRPWARPGSSVTVEAQVSSSRPRAAQVTVALLDLDRVICARDLDVTLGPQGVHISVAVELPPVPRHGYGLRMTVRSGGTVATAHSAVEAMNGWWQSPRMAGMTEFDAPAVTAERMTRLADWHVSVAQHYDWMWRHYRYVPPDGASDFSDTLGRTVSHEAVRAAVAAGHHRGIASLAYGSVYGAEPEHIEAYPEDRVFDASGQVLSLGETFYINDVRPGTAWRSRLLELYADAVAEFDFDAIHMDTYGEPHAAVASDGQAFEFADVYPGLIDEAAVVVEQARPGTRVTFNCVDGYPLEAVAPTAAACLYLELWPADGCFADLVRWTQRARRVAAGRQVIIAAYAAALRMAEDASARAGAIDAVLLAGTAIMVAGGYHHVLADGDRLITEGYYPAAIAMTATESVELKALWCFSARYVHLLTASGLRAGSLEGIRVYDAAGVVPVSDQPAPGKIWLTMYHDIDGTRRLHLVDLRTQHSDRWDEPRQPSTLSELRLDWVDAEHPLAMSPWTAGGDVESLARHPQAAALWQLPAFRRWLMVLA